MIYFNSKKINDDIRNYIERKLSKFSDGSKLAFSYLITNKSHPSNLTIISNYPEEWVEYYIKEKYHIIDPIIITAKNKVAPFSWDDVTVIDIKSKKSKVFDLAKAYNITHGYTFILYDNKYNQVTLSLTTIDEYHKVFFDEIIEEHKAEIQMLLIQTHSKMLSLYKNKSYNYIDNNVNCLITSRENEILYWASLGKTYLEISAILNIKKNTVKQHMSNIIKKMDVVNAKHAIRLGIELNIIRPVQ